MEKSIAEIMSEPAVVEEIIRKAKAINQRIADSESEGIEWPELEEEEPDHCICGHCDGTGCYICNYSGELYR